MPGFTAEHSLKRIDVNIVDVVVLPDLGCLM